MEILCFQRLGDNSGECSALSTPGGESFRTKGSGAAERPRKVRLQSIPGAASQEGHFMEMVEAGARYEKEL